MMLFPKYNCKTLYAGILFFLLLVSHNGFSQSNVPTFQPGARSVAMGTASVSSRNIWASFNNQANIAFYNKLAVGFHSENRFAVNYLSANSFIFTLPIDEHNNGFFNFSYLGFANYASSKLGVGFSKKLGETFAAGLQFNYYSVVVANSTYGRAGALSFELGLGGNINKNIRYGLHIMNPASVQLESFSVYPVSTVSSFGVSYYSENFEIASEVEKDTDFPVVYKLGAEYGLTEIIKFRGGVSTGFSKYSFGIGFQYKEIDAGFSFAYHEFLGFTPHISLSYAFN